MTRRQEYRVHRPNRRRPPELVPAVERAAEIRQDFMDAPSSRIDRVRWRWPTRFQHIGEVDAVVYASEKWDGGGPGSVSYAEVLKNPWRVEAYRAGGRLHSYKHIAESHQDLLVVPGILGDGDEDPSGRTPLSVYGDVVTLHGEMPDAFAVLAPALELQGRIFTADGDLGPTVELDLEGSLWGAAPLSDGGVMLFNYDQTGVRLAVLGDDLEVKKDGIVG
jgi:hypothetical protein